MRLSSPRVSIVTPVYNAESYLEATIESVQAQTLTDWEHLLVIDFKSKDQSERIARKWAQKDPRIRVLSGEKNQGVAQNRNRGIDEAQGDYVAFLDADDLWLPEKLQKQVAFMDTAGVNFSFHSYAPINEKGTLSGPVRQIRSSKVSYRDLLKDNQIGCLSVLLRRSTLGSHRFYAGGHEDFVLWLELLKAGEVARGLDECLAQYRIVPGSRSNNKLKAAHWRWRILRDVEKLGLLASLGFFSWYFYFSVFKRTR